MQVQLEVLEPPESQKNSDRLNRAQRKTASEAPQSSAGKTAQPHLAAAAERRRVPEAASGVCLTSL